MAYAPEKTPFKYGEAWTGSGAPGVGYQFAANQINQGAQQRGQGMAGEFARQAQSQGTNAPFPEYMGKDQAKRYEDMAKERQKALVYQPAAFQPGIERDYWSGRGVGEAFDQYQQAVGQFGAEGTQTGDVMNSIYGQAFGGDSVVQKQAQAQRQAVGQQIAQQAAMGSRGGYNPAMMRASAMAQGQMGAQMAAQTAAAMAQERQNAQRAYLMARQQQIQNYDQLRGATQQTQGGLLDMAQRRFEGQTSAVAGK